VPMLRVDSPPWESLAGCAAWGTGSYLGIEPSRANTSALG
jgi:hypothetical protein